MTASCLLLLFLLILLLAYLKKSRSYWKERDLPFLPSNIFLGHDLLLLCKKKPLNYHKQLYENLAPHRFGGLYHFQKPVLMIRDPDLIKSILITDYQYFKGHGFFFYNQNEDLNGVLFNMEGGKWKSERSRVLSMFTPHKNKTNLPLMIHQVNILVDKIDEQLKINDEIDLKSFIMRFVFDVAYRTAFGVQSDCVSEPNSEYFRIGKKVLYSNFRLNTSEVLYTVFPNLRSLLKLNHFDDDIHSFFKSLMNHVLKERKYGNTMENCFLDGLLDSEKIISSEDENILLDLCFDSFHSTIESIPNRIAFAIYELANNFELQEKAILEIRQVLSNGKQITYEDLNRFGYLDKIILETLRMYPALAYLIRTCSESYVIPNTKAIIEKGISVLLPMYAIQQDPHFFKDPSSFNPDRFAENNHHPFAFLPFGDGPRKCVGFRYGLTLIKISLVMLLHNFHFSSCYKTSNINFYMNSDVIESEDEIWLKVKRRKQ